MCVSSYVCVCSSGWGEFNQCQSPPNPDDPKCTNTHGTHTNTHVFTKLQMMCRPAVFPSLWWRMLLPNARQPESHLLLSPSPQRCRRSLLDNQHTTRGQQRVAQKGDEAERDKERVSYKWNIFTSAEFIYGSPPLICQDAATTNGFVWPHIKKVITLTQSRASPRYKLHFWQFWLFPRIIRKNWL